jgi:hypothetical protein
MGSLLSKSQTQGATDFDDFILEESNVLRVFLRVDYLLGGTYF